MASIYPILIRYLEYCVLKGVDVFDKWDRRTNQDIQTTVAYNNTFQPESALGKTIPNSMNNYSPNTTKQFLKCLFVTMSYNSKLRYVYSHVYIYIHILLYLARDFFLWTLLISGFIIMVLWIQWEWNLLHFDGYLRLTAKMKRAT